MCVQSPVTMTSCDGDSDSSHVTGSCSPSDSVHDAPRPPHHRRRLSRSLFPAGSPDVAASVQPPRTIESRHSTATVALPTPLAGWCPPPLVVDRLSAATGVLPELLGSDAYCRLAAAAAASIAGIYWGRRCDDKVPGVDLMLPWSSVAAAAAASFSLPTMTPSYLPTSDSQVSGMSLLSGSVLDGSSWLGMTKRTLQADDGMASDDKMTATPDVSGSSSPVDDLPLDLSPVAKRVRVNSPLTNVVAADGCSV